jgi:hypothetical protein
MTLIDADADADQHTQVSPANRMTHIDADADSDQHTKVSPANVHERCHDLRVLKFFEEIWV